MTCIIVKLICNSKRSHTDDEKDMSDEESVKCKKPRTDSTEIESVN